MLLCENPNFTLPIHINHFFRLSWLVTRVSLFGLSDYFIVDKFVEHIFVTRFSILVTRNFGLSDNFVVDKFVEHIS